MGAMKAVLFVALVALCHQASAAVYNKAWSVPVTLSDTIDMGDTVIWTWADTKPHNVNFLTVPTGFTGIATNGGANSLAVPMAPVVAPYTVSFTPTIPGTYTYNCIVHSNMVGTLVVREGPLSSKPNSGFVVRRNLLQTANTTTNTTAANATAAAVPAVANTTAANTTAAVPVANTTTAANTTAPSPGTNGTALANATAANATAIQAAVTARTLGFATAAITMNLTTLPTFITSDFSVFAANTSGPLTLANLTAIVGYLTTNLAKASAANAAANTTAPVVKQFILIDPTAAYLTAQIPALQHFASVLWTFVNATNATNSTTPNWYAKSAIFLPAPISTA